MLSAAAIVLGVAVLLGAVLAVLAMRERAVAPPPLALAGLHGALAVAGFGLLAAALQGPPRGLSTGTASFGATALVILALAGLAGFGILALHLRKRRLPGLLIGVHGTLAVTGFVILAAYVMVG
jgi:hypothetical protein